MEWCDHPNAHISLQKQESRGIGSNPFLKECHIFFRQRPQVRLDIGGKCIGIDLIRWLGVTKIFVRRRPCNKVAQIIVGKLCYTVNFFLLFISQIVGNISNMVNRRIIISQWIRAECLILSNTRGRRRLAGVNWTAWWSWRNTWWDEFFYRCTVPRGLDCWRWRQWWGAPWNSFNFSLIVAMRCHVAISSLGCSWSYRQSQRKFIAPSSFFDLA